MIEKNVSRRMDDKKTKNINGKESETFSYIIKPSFQFSIWLKLYSNQVILGTVLKI